MYGHLKYSTGETPVQTVWPENFIAGEMIFMCEAATVYFACLPADYPK